ncbi:ribosome recycling factor [Oceanobacillus massiliensis]|uniref:ribosome recycling factor n=1 Tax=Oceanobacillus massiliensis TaxID=1465765 RepID=UPI00028A1C45|nr:ribosome recycling factor [Oceanobacillus massiliensis]
MSEAIMNEMNEKMEQAVQAFSKNLASVRAGRANPSLLDSIYVDYYGASTPLNQLATVGAPEARLLTITPYDKTVLSDIERAIQIANLGLSPSNDGNMIRINIPPLTEERRKDLVKVVGKYVEESRVQIRNIRRDINDSLKKSEKNGDLTEDDLRAFQDDVQKATNDYISKLDELAKNKEKEIMEV